MPFLKRLGFYLVGLSIGLVFLAFFFKKKSEETGTSFCYFPNCRVLKDLRSKPLTYTSAAAEQFAANYMDSTAIAYVLTEGDVDFENSDTKARPCKIFVVKAAQAEKETTLTLTSCEDKVVVEEILVQ